MRRVALVDDHEVVAVALKSAIDAVPGLQFSGVAGTVDELLAAHPDAQLVVLDLRLVDGSSPVSNVERLTQAGMDVVVYTSGENPHLLRAAARTPILGIVRKSAPFAALVEMLERAGRSESFMSTELASAIETDPRLGAAELSAQEQRVLALFAQGLKAQVVSHRLGIAVPTVHDYVRRIRSKYAEAGRPAHTKIDLYIRAVEDGILPSPALESSPVLEQ